MKKSKHTAIKEFDWLKDRLYEISPYDPILIDVRQWDIIFKQIIYISNEIKKNKKLTKKELQEYCKLLIHHFDNMIKYLEPLITHAWINYYKDKI